MSVYDDVVQWSEAVGADHSPGLWWKLIQEEYTELHDALMADNLVETADAIADLTWVLAGLAWTLKIPYNEVWAEVLRSNNAKLLPDGTVMRREDGKILKPEGWTPPDIEGVLRRG